MVIVLGYLHNVMEKTYIIFNINDHNFVPVTTFIVIQSQFNVMT